MQKLIFCGSKPVIATIFANFQIPRNVVSESKVKCQSSQEIFLDSVSSRIDEDDWFLRGNENKSRFFFGRNRTPMTIVIGVRAAKISAFPFIH